MFHVLLQPKLRLVAAALKHGMPEPTSQVLRSQCLACLHSGNVGVWVLDIFRR